MKSRYLSQHLKSDLKEKMVILAGPRQVGKTTLARSIAQKHLYLNYDIASDRMRILRYEFDASPLWIFDEIHKFQRWKNYLKGVFDEHHRNREILVTGSARLDMFRKAGDSLQGRYHYLRLLPFSASEIGATSQKDLNSLFVLGGFPEPFLKGSKTGANRWTSEYQARLVHEEVRSMERVLDISAMELLNIRLPECVGSPLSINSLREDLGFNHKTVSRWLDLLERYYSIFRVSPMGVPVASKIKAVKKEQKHYHMDWNVHVDDGKRFENFIAVHLLKYCHFLQDTEGRKIELRYFRNTEGKEVDFTVVENGRPKTAIECKFGDADIGDGLKIIKNKFPDVNCWQVHWTGKKDYVSKEGVRVAPSGALLATLT